MKWFLTLPLTLALLLPQGAMAESLAGCYPYIGTLGDHSARERIPALLKAKKFAALEQELNHHFAQYERGEYSDLALRWEIGGIDHNNPETGQLAQAWLAAIPQSFFAQLVIAEHDISLGYDARGKDIAARTTPEQFAAMEAKFQKAVVALKKAIRLRPKSALPYALLMRMSRATSGASYTQMLLAQANQADPRNLSARHGTIYALQPRWGGSFAAMDAVATQAAHDGLSDVQVDVIRYSIAMKKADHLLEIDKDKRQAIAYWNQAAQLCHTGYPWTRIAQVAVELQDWNLLEDVSRRILEKDPDNIQAINHRGLANEMRRDVAFAVQDYERNIQRGDPWAQTHLGEMLAYAIFGIYDAPRGKQLLEQAAAQGHEPARTILKRLNDPKPQNEIAIDPTRPLWIVISAQIVRDGFALEEKGQIQEAVKNYEMALDMNHAWAQNRLGTMLIEGKLVPQDVARGTQLLQKSAAQGNDAARITLAKMQKAPE